jgi:hypothetical protein
MIRKVSKKSLAYREVIENPAKGYACNYPPVKKG